MIQIYGVSFVHHFFATRFIDTILKLKISTGVSYFKRLKFHLLMIPHGNQSQNHFICYAEIGLQTNDVCLKFPKSMFFFKKNLEHHLKTVN